MIPPTLLPDRSHGFSMLEILVAIVVISLGLLGLAGLQAASLVNNQTAHYRSVATQQAFDMTDRIRANLAGVRAGNYNDLQALTPADPACFTAVGGCTVANMAITDHFQWNTNNARLLPAGVGTVRCIEGPNPPGGCVNNGPNWTFDITVSWSERRSRDVNVVQNFVTRFSP
jgi:type IV pilus assembly protein PilV